MEILNAITYHTSGRVDMTLLEKSYILLIILNRDVISLESTKSATAKRRFGSCCHLQALRNTIVFLMKKIRQFTLTHLIHIMI